MVDAGIDRTYVSRVRPTLRQSASVGLATERGKDETPTVKDSKLALRRNRPDVTISAFGNDIRQG